MELQDYLRILRRYWLGVVLIVGVTLGATAVFTYLQPKVYTASAGGFVSTSGNDTPSLAAVNDQVARSRAVSYVVLAKSRAVADRVISKLGLNVDASTLVQDISVDQQTNTVLLTINASADTPEQAKQLADAWVAALAAQVATIEDPQGTDAPGVPKVVPIESAELPKTPSSPKPLRNYALGLAAGLLLGLAYALTRNTLDRRLRSAEDVERLFQLPVVGLLPISRALTRTREDRAILVLNDSRVATRDGGAAEALRKLRTNLLYMDVDNPPRAIVITSPKQGEGKSTIAENLATAIAASGQPALLIDADLRRPMIAKSLGLVESVGLTDVLVGRVTFDEAVQSVSDSLDLQVLTSGRIPPNPSELLGSGAMGDLLDKLSQDRVVILDAPPLLPVTDAAVLSAKADGALVAVTAGKSVERELDLALHNLDAVHARPLGIIMNRVPKRGAGSDYYAGYVGDYTPFTEQAESASSSGRGDDDAAPATSDRGKRHRS